jgi:hypothetical protein
MILELSNNDQSLFAKVMAWIEPLSIGAIATLQPIIPIHEGLRKMVKILIQGYHR